ncbi:helix-turn-helix transcriptional regulator [Corynebacterium qintianiae]|uniref:helix-turn-helix transcriptional regulator n=1 Tax=Corynebacterium qintianiae TaxID=2709392 RepID=UPI0013EAB422|nr:WYL domain-containing protein [Corynebacterium qintianiae]
MKDSPAKLVGLVRSLNLIPYLHRHPGATPMEIARDLGYPHTEVMRDLTRLSMSGVGSGPGELIDLVASWTGITVIDDQGLNKPLRLTPTEANALLLTLESLETMPGLVDQAAVTSAAVKLRAAVKGHSVDDTEPVTGASTSDVRVLTDAIARSRRLSITYYSASSGAITARTVSPVAVFHQNGHSYLRAYEDGLDEPKSFRLDRIKNAQLIDAPSDAPFNSGTFDPTDPFGFANRHRAELLIRREATWLADYWEIELDLEAGTGEWVPAAMPYGSDDWLVRFCLSQADRVELVEPVELARDVVARAQTALDALS